jgi:malate synthase
MGGMSAQIPIKNDPQANEVAMAKVVSDKVREVTAGHDGTWIAHPLINVIAKKVFDEHMLGPNQVCILVYFSMDNALKYQCLVPCPPRGSSRHSCRSREL